MGRLRTQPIGVQVLRAEAAHLLRLLGYDYEVLARLVGGLNDIVHLGYAPGEGV
jgi:hypothetical protein